MRQQKLIRIIYYLFLDGADGTNGVIENMEIENYIEEIKNAQFFAGNMNTIFFMPIRYPCHGQPMGIYGLPMGTHNKIFI